MRFGMLDEYFIGVAFVEVFVGHGGSLAFWKVENGRGDSISSN